MRSRACYLDIGVISLIDMPYGYWSIIQSYLFCSDETRKARVTLIFHILGAFEMIVL